MRVRAYRCCAELPYLRTRISFSFPQDLPPHIRNKAEPIVLLACGTFDQASGARMKEILRDCTDLHLQERLAEVAAPTSVVRWATLR